MRSKAEVAALYAHAKASLEGCKGWEEDIFLYEGIINTLDWLNGIGEFDFKRGFFVEKMEVKNK